MINSTPCIIAFNKKFSQTIMAFEHPYRDKLFDEVSKFHDYYTAVDSLGDKYGLEIACEVIEDKKGEKFIPILRKKEKHEGNYIIDIQRISSELKDINKCYEYLAKEWIYKIVSNENFINSKSISR